MDLAEVEAEAVPAVAVVHPGQAAQVVVQALRCCFAIHGPQSQRLPLSACASLPAKADVAATAVQVAAAASARMARSEAKSHAALDRHQRSQGLFRVRAADAAAMAATAAAVAVAAAALQLACG